MPVITALERVRRRGGELYDLHVDGELVARLPRSLIDETGLVAGAEITRADLTTLLAEADRRRATDAALRALDVRPRGEAEMRDRLARRGHPAAAVEAALAECRALGHLDDVEFAAAYARDRIRLKPRGRMALESELRRKGVSAADAAAGIRRAFRDEAVTEPELLWRVAHKKWRALRGRPPEIARRRLAAHLQRRGFPYADIRDVLDRLARRD